MPFKNLFAELQRRNVFRAAAAYGVVAWLLIQIATQVFPFFDIPNWAVRLVIVALLIGFPVAMVLAWVFEFTPQGFKRTEDIAPEQSVRRSTGRKLDFAVIGALVVVISLLLMDRWRPSHERSVAVLPFQNFSDDKEKSAFLVDGIQEDILTSLAKIKDLHVISRTSVAQFRGATQNVRAIGKLLGATNILEGSVQRAGDKVRVTVQLLDAAQDRHLWAEAYDRTLTDALSLQGELATEIAERLRATLTPEEKQRVNKKPTANAEAYMLFLRARQFEQKPDTLLTDFKRAEQLYQQALARDPAFALAHARLGQTRANIYHFYEPTDSVRREARAEAETALQLDPNLSEAHHALGLCYYWCDRDYEKALQEFRTAQSFAPSASEPGFLIAAIRRRQGHWQEALDGYNRVAALDPQNPNIFRNIEYTNTALRDWPAAARAAEGLRAVARDAVDVLIQAAYIDLWWRGTTATLATTLQALPGGNDPDGVVTCGRWERAMIDRDFVAADRALQECSLDEISYLNGGLTPKSYCVGLTALARGDETTARAQLEAARPKFEAAMAEAPTNAQRHANLGLLYAFLGRKDDAIREGRRAVELNPESADALDGALMSANLALIYARSGAADQALPLIERLLRTPGPVDGADYSITRNDLRLRWEWDPLRGDPRFKAVVDNPEPETRRD